MIKTPFDVSRLIKFSIVGAIGTIPNYIGFKTSLFLLETYAMSLAPYWLLHDFSWGFGIVCGMISNYLLNEYWTFRGKTDGN